MIRTVPITIAMISKTKNYMASAAMTTKKMKATVIKNIITALTITIMIIAKITKNNES